MESPDFYIPHGHIQAGYIGALRVIIKIIEG
jgi:hypothetical protein